MDRPARFRLELRAVVVSFKAALRSFHIDGRAGTPGDDDRAAGAEQRALALLDGVENRFTDVTASADGRLALEAARHTIRARDVRVASEDPAIEPAAGPT